jgi:hypothetical protein
LWKQVFPKTATVLTVESLPLVPPVPPVPPVPLLPPLLLVQAPPPLGKVAVGGGCEHVGIPSVPPHADADEGE